MNIVCPECDTTYRLDPARIPIGGIEARCRSCGVTLRIDPGHTDPGTVRHAVVVPAMESGAAPGGETGGEASGIAGEAAQAVTATTDEAPSSAPGATERARPETPVFGPQDPETRAKRLARALVSDIVVYNPEKWEEARNAGTLRKEFRDEILKSWDEYVEQVGEGMAKKTPYFRDALNAILAEGKSVF